MLYEPTRHEPLRGGIWDEGRVVEGIARIVEDAVERFEPDSFWPAHPRDLDEDDLSSPYKSLYFGATGVLWALWYLERQGMARLPIEAGEVIRRIYEAYLAAPDTGEVVPSSQLGEVGILTVAWRMLTAGEGMAVVGDDFGPATVADRLFSLIRSNVRNPTLESLWGAPGTMLTAWYMGVWTGEARWRDLFLENVDQLWDSWSYAERYGCHLWTQDLYGSIVKLIGAGHGFAGNVYPMLMGAPLLSGERQRMLYDRCLETVRATAHLENGLANWPQSVGEPRPGRTSMLVQWCHGAPGMITGLGPLPVGARPELDALLRQGGELTWAAGPLEKGPGLCHGTAGNGYAFLKLYRRTGEPAWLERARAFAMHALEQCEAARTRHGQGRYSLWTGDLGVAIYLHHCRTGEDGMPGLDLF